MRHFWYIMFFRMPEVDFQIAYSGEAVDAGLMDVHDLAPALLALGDLFQEANRLLNGDRAQIAVNVSAEFERASFDVHIKAVQGLIEQAREFLLGQGVTSAKEILDRLGTFAKSGLGLFAFLRWLRNRKITRATTLEDGRIRIEVSGGDHMDVDSVVVKLS